MGYLTGNLYDQYQNVMLQAAIDVTREQNANLIAVLTAGAWVKSGQAQTRNIILELLGTENVEGLVIENAWADYSKAVCEMFEPLPMTCATLEIPGIPSVVGENRQGIRELVSHLVEVHGYHQIAFVHAPLDDVAERDEQARFEGYLEVLESHQIPYNPDLVVRSSNWDLSAARENIRILLDERQVKPDALIAFNDLLARWTMEALQERGIRVPRDIAVVGYDDLEAYRFLTPPLTTVHLPIAEKVRLATEMLFDSLAGQTIPEHVTLPTRLVVRRSCGCQSSAVSDVRVTGDATGRTPAVPFADRAEVRAAIQTELMQQIQTAPNHPIRPEQIIILLDAFFRELDDGQRGVFLPILDEVLNATIESENHIRVWQDVISMLHQRIAPLLNEKERLVAEGLFDRSRVMIGETIEQEHVQQKLREQHQLRILGSISQALIASLKIEDLSDILSRWLPLLNIQRCYISRYEDPNAPAEWSQLIAAYDQRKLPAFNEENRRFRSRQLIPPGLLDTDSRYSLVLVPMHFGEEQFGFAVFEFGPKLGFVYELLGGQLGNMLKGSQLYEGALRARATAEKADQIKTRLLANVSHELRTPLNIIMNYAQTARDLLTIENHNLPAELNKYLIGVQQSAEHQLRLINDLLDLSRAEIDELDMEFERIEPRPLLEDTFQSMAGSVHHEGVSWRLDLPAFLPFIDADPVRMRQVVLNLLSNAGKYTESGEIVLGADATPTQLHIWVRDSGIGIPLDQQEHIFEPFNTIVQPRRQPGIGLGLSITRRLVALHQGTMRLESHPGQGSTFHIYIPVAVDIPSADSVSTRQVLLLISSSAQPTAEMIAFSRQQGLEIRQVTDADNLEALLNEIQPAALAWNLADAGPDSDSLALVQRVRKLPRLARLPFILYGHEAIPDSTISTGVVSVVVGKTLSDAVSNLHPTSGSGPILIVEDDPLIREQHRRFVEKELTGYLIRTAEDGAMALEVMLTETPTLVILDLNMPKIDGFEVLDWMRANQRLRQVPVVILTNRSLTLEDVERLEHHARVNVQNKGILNDDETGSLLNQILTDSATLPAYTSALVKRTVAYFQQDYSRPLSRKEVAQVIGLSENYLSQIFRQELGISPWEYLNRYRIKQARELLAHTDESISSIAMEVGFEDPSYFGRVFHKITGLSPREYREKSTWRSFV
jgi:signal transduction histidine kinase/DNA-binding LacI/PurR family transcriptional regulator/AraC-like DNA-binding protein/DNA-binding response OmpR family regulator